MNSTCLRSNVGTSGIFSAETAAGSVLLEELVEMASPELEEEGLVFLGLLYEVMCESCIVNLKKCL